MAAVQPVPDDEVAAEFAASWAAGDDAPAPAAVVGHRSSAVPGHRLVRPDRADRPGPVDRRRHGDPPDLQQAAARVRPVSLAGEHALPLAPAFSAVLPAGLPRGHTVAIASAGPPNSVTAIPGGATTLALALAAAPSAEGAWVAAVGLPGLGLAAAAEVGVALERLVLIEPPPPEQWTTVVGALVGAFDVVLVTPPRRLRPGEIRRMAARSRERGSVLIQLGLPGSVGGVDGAGHGPAATGLDPDLRISVRTVGWLGLGLGHGHLDRRQVVVEVGGRRQASRSRRSTLWLPDADGQVRLVAPGELLADSIISGSGPTRAHPGPGSGPESAGDLRSARLDRVRRVARRSLPLPPAPAKAWSDAG